MNSNVPAWAKPAMDQYAPRDQTGEELAVMSAFGLSLREGQVLLAMAHREVAEAQDFPSLSYSTRQIIYTLRRKLRPYGLKVVAHGKGSYGLDPRSKAHVQSVLPPVGGG